MLRALLICAATGVMAAGCASAPTSPQPAQVTVTKTGGQNCVGSVSASRIPESGCNAPGQSYTQTDIRSTGQPSPGAALQMLDPTIH